MRTSPSKARAVGHFGHLARLRQRDALLEPSSPATDCWLPIVLGIYLKWGASHEVPESMW